jgi:anti-anti-sigma factor
MSEETLVKFEQHDEITVGTVYASSVLDAMNVNLFGKEVLEHVRDKRGIRLLLDFHKVEYLSSAVLTELLRISQACKENGGDVRLCSLNKDIRKVFEITNLDKMFTIYGPADEAVPRYKRSLAIEAEEGAWLDVSKNI